MTANPCSTVADLGVVWDHRRGTVPILDGVSLSIAPGETVALVGESGAGKSMLALAVMGLLARRHARRGRQHRARRRRARRRDAGHDPSEARRADGDDLPGPAVVAASRVPGRRPDRRRRSARTARCATKPTRAARAVELLAARRHAAARGAGAATIRTSSSGGMRQRVMIAMAIANDPHLLIADEATTALDVTVQAQVLDVLRDAQQRTGAAMLLVTHDLGVVAGDRRPSRGAVRRTGRGGRARSPRCSPRPCIPYTLGAAARGAPARRVATRPFAAIPGQPPNPGAWPSGCVFHPRCEFADERCCHRACRSSNPVP